jgi:hypothetical protein
MNFRIAFALGALLLGDLAEVRSQPIVLSPAEAAKQGPPLAREILSLAPSANFTNVGVLKVRAARDRISQIPIRFKTVTNAMNWSTLYESTASTNFVSLLITYGSGQTNRYEFLEFNDRLTQQPRILAGNGTMVPFAGSDFWVADLGLEFLNWPAQRLLRKEIRRGQSCAVLESINPHAAPGAYSRVLSWIDIDTDGIINAEAYDSKGKLLKEFAVTSLKKVRGQMELKGMEISNRQTGSRTTLEFDLAGEK